jgi:hypothetical protein
MSKHTAGPWVWVADDQCAKLVGADGDVCDFGDATMYYPTAGNAPNAFDSALIAAAPDLLAALKGVMFALECEDGDPDWNERVRACHDAIAKAEGAA